MNRTYPTPRPATADQHEWIRALSEDAREPLILPPTYDAAERRIERLHLAVEAVNDETLLRCAGR